ncbi:hypothetical protein ES703_99107 [subsurface metagenome]
MQEFKFFFGIKIYSLVLISQPHALRFPPGFNNIPEHKLSGCPIYTIMTDMSIEIT